MITTLFESVVLATLPLLLSASSGQEERYRESQTLDPDSSRWVVNEQQGPLTPVDQARRLLLDDEADDAEDLLEDWIESNLDHARYLEAIYLLGESEFVQEDFWRAYEYFEQVVDNGSGELFYKALQREIDVARAFLSGKKRIVWRFMKFDAVEEGIEILDRVWERSPGTDVGESALKIKSDFFFASGDMDLAQDEYANLASQYPHGRYVQYALLRSADAAAAQFSGVRYDDRPLVDAQERYRQLDGDFPMYAEDEGVQARLDGIRELRAAKDLEIARWYQKTRKVDAAAYYYQLVLDGWPGTLAALDAQRGIVSLGQSLEPAVDLSEPDDAPIEPQEAPESSE